MTGRLVFIGAVHEAQPALYALLTGPAEVAAVVTRPPESAGGLCGYVDLAPLATAYGVPVVHTADANDSLTAAAVGVLEPDLLVVIGWNDLVGAELLRLPPRGCVGCHASLLPQHRGHAPVNWSIIRGEAVTGNTMLMLAPGADTGDIVDQREIPLDPYDTCASAYAKVGAAGAAMLRAHLPALLAGTAPRRPQHASDGDALPKRIPAMGVTDWSRSATAVHDWIRAQTVPYPGAYTRLGGRTIMLWRSRPPIPAAHGVARPGTVLAVGAEGVTVAAGTGTVTVTAMSHRGEPPQSAGAWSAGAGVAPGVRFDPVDGATACWALGLGPRPATVGVS